MFPQLKKHQHINTANLYVVNAVLRSYKKVKVRTYTHASFKKG